MHDDASRIAVAAAPSVNDAGSGPHEPGLQTFSPHGSRSTVLRAISSGGAIRRFSRFAHGAVELRAACRNGSLQTEAFPEERRYEGTGMRKRFVGPLLLALFVLAPAGAQQVFRDGFETPCDPTDVDGDRLNGYAEVGAQTDPLIADTDDDGMSDGDEVLGTLGGLDLPALGVNPRRKDILLEYDWFDDSSEQGTSLQCPLGVHSHRPTQKMLDIVTVMFGAAPVANPNGQSGINVIHDFGQGGHL